MKSGFQAPGTQDCLSSAYCYLHITSAAYEMKQIMWNFNNCHRNSKLSGGFCNNNTSKGEFCDLPLLFCPFTHRARQTSPHSVIGQPSARAFSYFLLSKWLWWESFSTWYPYWKWFRWCRWARLLEKCYWLLKALLNLELLCEAGSTSSITYKWGLIPQQAECVLSW